MDRLCCLWSFHDKTTVVVVLYAWTEDSGTGTVRQAGLERRCELTASLSINVVSRCTDTHWSGMTFPPQFRQFFQLLMWCYTLLGPQLNAVTFYSELSMLKDQWAPHTPADRLSRFCSNKNRKKSISAIIPYSSVLTRWLVAVLQVTV